MMKVIEHIYIISTILFTVYSQLIMRWQVGLAGGLPADGQGKIVFIINLLLNPWVISGVVATFLAGVSWMLAMTKFEISYAFPFISLNYILILFAAFILFGETFSMVKIIGTTLVVVGLLVIARG
ncbi:MAG: EamA family transporter [Gammaproteobacteria bacterium]|nr:EamA family transporter [Gammaproteobacteria bacterium]